MRLENSFRVPAPPEEAWKLLNDVPAVVPCMPGAELTEVVSDRQYKGKVHIKMGPVSLSFNGDVDITERDEVAKRMVMKAKGSEMKGKGQAAATVISSLERSGSGTRMRISQDIDLSGPLAQYGRGMIQDVSGSLMNEFADRIQADLSRGKNGAAPVAAPVRKKKNQVSGSPSRAGSSGSSRSCSAKTGAES